MSGEARRSAVQECLVRENGIRAFVLDEYTAATRYPWFWFLYVSAQIRLRVPFGEHERGLDILREAAEGLAALNRPGRWAAPSS